jgi:hypothetical protein
MPKVALPGELLGTTVESAYQGTVYEQTVHIRVNNGTKIDLFDGTSVIDEGQIGESGDFVVLVLPRESPTIVDDEDSGIRPASNPSSKWSYEFRGEIMAVNSDDRWFNQPHDNMLVLDIGLGSILIESNEAMRQKIANESLHPGDFVCVTASRTDLIGMAAR